MWHQTLIGLLLGWGAAVPLGPINVEMIRRNLRDGTRRGFYFGLGACTADLTYFILLLTGLIIFLQKSNLLWHLIGIVGSLLLIWFAVGAFRSRVISNTLSTVQEVENTFTWRHYFQGYLMTLINPMTVLFWASISASLTSITQAGRLSEINVGIGIMFGIITWISLLNVTLHFARHRIPEKAMRYLNYMGGSIILCFGIFSLFHALG